MADILDDIFILNFPNTLSGKNSSGKSDEILAKWRKIFPDLNFPRWKMFPDEKFSPMNNFPRQNIFHGWKFDPVE